MIGNFRSADPASGARLIGRAPVPKTAPLNAPTEVPPSGYDVVKRAMDIFLGIAFLVLLAPVILVAATLIVFTSRGPAFYTQTRMGRFGKPFVIWKLRSMTHRCEDKSGARWSTKGDARVTPVGRVLRRLHIDEFPQLLNVIKGEMSLVGPRPERPEFFPVLSASVPQYAQRLMVKPGVTGLAQVYLPPDEDVAGVRRKQVYDLHYIRNYSITLDIRLMIATAMQAVGGPHFLVRFCLALPRSKSIESGPSSDVN